MAYARMNMWTFVLGLITVFSATIGIGWMRLLIFTTCTSYGHQARRIPGAFESFSNYVDRNYDWYRENCFAEIGEQLSISNLNNSITLWGNSNNPVCSGMYVKFSSIYSIDNVSGQLDIPETFKPKLLKWLNNDKELFDEVKLQCITTVFNKYTHEGSTFHPLRAKRPGVAVDDDFNEYIEKLSAETEQNCDFCQYKYKTAKDTFGRIESEHSATAANAFKFDGYHALVLLKTHHPLLYSEEQFMDFMKTAMTWYKTVNTLDKQYRYPHLSWDSLPKAGASQVHPHAHLTLNPIRYYGLMEHIKLTAIQYSQQHDGQNYFSHLLQVHASLGLTTTLGNASAMAYLTPKKDHEIVILSKTPSEDFFRLLYYTIRAFIDDMHMYAWSLAMFLPEMKPTNLDGYDEIPAIVRIITRGSPTSSLSDISSLELFAASNVNIDPFSVIQHIENSVKSRSQP